MINLPPVETYDRTFHVASLTPCSSAGDVEGPIRPETFLVGEFGDGAFILADLLPAGSEISIAEAADMPEWASKAYLGISTICGDLSGIVLYRQPGAKEVQALAFAEVIMGEIRLSQTPGRAFEPERYADPTSFAYHGAHFRVFIHGHEPLEVSSLKA